MGMFEQSSSPLRRAICLALTGAGLALTTQNAAAAEEQSQELDEVVVTGFRGSLNTALAEKRNETAAIDVIAAEDIGKFPDSNLAESMQRIPGVALTRSDGGEGRNIHLRAPPSKPLENESAAKSSLFKIRLLAGPGSPWPPDR